MLSPLVGLCLLLLCPPLPHARSLFTEENAERTMLDPTSREDPKFKDLQRVCFTLLPPPRTLMMLCVRVEEY